MLKTILSISGKPGLYKLISQGKNMLIVETIDATKKRFPAYGNEKIISLADIAMYTNDSEVPLRDVLRSIKEKLLLSNYVNIWLRFCLTLIVTEYIPMISRN